MASYIVRGNRSLLLIKSGIFLDPVQQITSGFRYTYNHFVLGILITMELAFGLLVDSYFMTADKLYYEHIRMVCAIHLYTVQPLLVVVVVVTNIIHYYCIIHTTFAILFQTKLDCIHY